ncbi:hypothetical protein SBF1_1620019 [Candidatus Desulfosporosinus infrequens]|uniref:Uncharacterized protein n=1 Tax=Candidatus Desulfosporosinus infrequens TaxID=2043169 RepID=A0A2U3K9X7_9FIRM|nr:hypothetical protein SBF1_1620019 [Candidatus Desulfosporosinus infrequens]
MSSGASQVFFTCAGQKEYVLGGMSIDCLAGRDIKNNIVH